MALIVEDGTVVAGAESYGTVAEGDTYWTTNRFDTTGWTVKGTSEKEKVLREATQYLDANYRWKGTISDTDQVLDWPRVNAVDDEARTIGSSTIPEVLKQALFELAKLALTGQLVPSPARGGQVKRSKVDVLETEYFSSASAGRTFAFVDSLLGTITTGKRGSGSARAIRA